MLKSSKSSSGSISDLEKAWNFKRQRLILARRARENEREIYRQSHVLSGSRSFIRNKYMHAVVRIRRRLSIVAEGLDPLKTDVFKHRDEFGR